MDKSELRNRFTWHPPHGEDQPTSYEIVRQMALELAKVINDSQPDSREKSLAITALEETVMWANAGIARNT